MNNLTPLQEVAATLMAGMLSGLYADTTVITVDFKSVRQIAIDEAKALLEATKPEPLEWKDAKVKGYTHPFWYSKGFEFVIVQTNGGSFNVCSTKNIDFTLGCFPTLDEAKAFTEHIRTR
jgi:hypothetical protein